MEASTMILNKKIMYKFYEPHIVGDFVMHTWIYYCIDGCLHYDDLMWMSQW